jgi:hypothetical protein
MLGEQHELFKAIKCNCISNMNWSNSFVLYMIGCRIQNGWEFLIPLGYLIAQIYPRELALRSRSKQVPCKVL